MIYINFSRLPDHCDCFDDDLDCVKFCLKANYWTETGPMNEVADVIEQRNEKRDTDRRAVRRLCGLFIHSKKITISADHIRIEI